MDFSEKTFIMARYDMMRKKTILLLRHGETGYSGRYIGSSDVPLTREGRIQIEKLRARLTKDMYSKVVASPRQRCRTTCELLCADMDVCYDPRLQEIDFGRWEGKNFQEIQESDPELVERWANWSETFCFPEGESIHSFLGRVHSFAADITKYSEENILVVSHGGVSRHLLCKFLGLSAEKYLLFPLQKGKYATVEVYGKRGVLTGFNLP